VTDYPAATEAAGPTPPDTFDYDQKLPLDVASRPPTVIGDVQVSELSYALPAGGRAAAFVVSGGYPTSGPGIVLAHGGSADGRRLLMGEAAALAGLGFTVLLAATSFPGPDDAAAVAAALTTAVLTQRRGIDVLIEWSGVDPGRLGFFGHSGGAYQGAILSAVEPRLGALVLASAGSGTPLRRAAAQLRESVTRDNGSYLALVQQFDPARYVAIPGHRHLLFQNGRDDHIVAPAEARSLHDAAAPPRQWLEYPCGHDTDTYLPARRDRDAFFSAWL
jgi:hypothetical protein